jgi:peptidoglycan/xylan/chitin deacetylase (PgdA/CDA1 family)
VDAKRLQRSILVAAALAGCGGGDAGPAERPAKTARPARPSVDLDAKPSAIAARSSIPILCYHQLRPQTAGDSAVDRQYIMPPARFRSQLDTLQRRGFHTITPDQLLAHLTTGAKLPPKPVLLTFDDAVDDHYRVALPELRRRHMTATFFVMTVVLGNDGFMTRGQVRRLDRAGMTVAAHTWDHHRVDEYVGKDWRTQIDEPAKTLQRIVGHRIRYFAYPFGVWSRDAFSHLHDAGFHAAFQLIEKPISFADPLMTIRRKIADPAWSSKQFEQALRSGFRKVGA